MSKSKARLAMDKDRDYIFEIFGNNCIRCGQETNIIHEIVPISHGKSSWHWKNRVPICPACHNWAHGIGTRNSIPILQDFRERFLVRKFNLTESDIVSEIYL